MGKFGLEAFSIQARNCAKKYAHGLIFLKHSLRGSSNRRLSLLGWAGRRADLSMAVLFSVLGALGVVTTQDSFADDPRARHLLLCDFDGTLVGNHNNIGTFSTPYILYRIHDVPPGAGFMKEPFDGPDQIEISDWDFRRLTEIFPNTLSRRSGGSGIFWGSMTRFTLQDGRVIMPGFYELQSPRSFAYFLNHLDPKPNKNRLIEAYEQAIAAPTPSGFKPLWPGHQPWQGRMFRIMQLRLSQEATALDTGIFTIRYHPPEHWKSFWRRLKKDGHIQFEPNPALMINAGDPRYDHIEPNQSLSVRKPRLLAEFQKTLQMVALGNAEAHSLIIAEDNQDTITRIFDLFKMGAMAPVNGTSPIRYGIFNAGTTTQIRESGLQEFAMIERDGSTRPATALEKLGFPEKPSDEQKAFIGQRGCEENFE